MEIDHIFIFSNTKGKAADALVEFGLTEGSSRSHPGQGTTNRKFYFENFFLEILWVVNTDEIQGELTSRTKLWERSQFDKNGYSPFGLCMANSKATDVLFKNSERYQPAYFPKGKAIDFITNEQFPQLPWTFRLPYRNGPKVTNEPREHPNGIKRLTRTEFSTPFGHGSTEVERHFENKTDLEFTTGPRHRLTLEFDHKIQGKEKEFPDLRLTIKY